MKTTSSFKSLLKQQLIDPQKYDFREETSSLNTPSQSSFMSLELFIHIQRSGFQAPTQPPKQYYARPFKDSPPWTNSTQGAQTQSPSQESLTFEPQITPPKASSYPLSQLSQKSRQALYKMRQLGATDIDLLEDLSAKRISARSLKKAFRKLALRYHPDGKPHLSAHQVSRLNEHFCQAHLYYQTVLNELREFSDI